MKTAFANTATFDQSAIEQAIAGAQAIIERLPYMGKKARRVEKQYTVIGRLGKASIVESYLAYDEGHAMQQFNEDYPEVHIVNAHRSRIERA